MNIQSSTIVQRLWNYCNFLHDDGRLSVVGEVPCGDDIESAVEVDLVRAGRLRQSVLRSAFEGRL
jgi:hypothetical protein